MDTRGTWGLLKQSFKDFNDDECPRMAAALSYFTVFSLPPLLILVLTLVGVFVDPQQARGLLEQQVTAVMGANGAAQIQTMIEQANRPGSGNVLQAVMGIAALLFGATGAFMQLQAALNRAWEVEPDPGQGGLRNFVFKRLLSLGMILALAFLLLVSLVLSAIISGLGQAVGRVVPGTSEGMLLILDFAVTLAVITTLFAAMYKVLPDAVIAWRDVWVGAAVTALLFVLGKFALGLYLGHSNPGEAYGAAGSLALILVWIYYSAMILLFGAEFTQAWAIRNGGGIRPEPGARRLHDEVPTADG